MRTFLLVACAMILISSCKKEKAKIILSGIYTEATPVAGRYQIAFLNENMLVKSEPGTAVTDTFYYNIADNYITLKHKTQVNFKVRVEFQKTGNSSFKIEDLSVKIPESQTTYMIFKK